MVWIVKNVMALLRSMLNFKHKIPKRQQANYIINPGRLQGNKTLSFVLYAMAEGCKKQSLLLHLWQVINYLIILKWIPQQMLLSIMAL